MKSLITKAMALAIAVCAATGAAKATTINLDTLSLTNGTAIEVASPGFGSSGPVTANWDPFSNTNTSLLFWNGDYSGRDAAYCQSGSVSGCALDLTVASGFEITLDSFFLGGWPNTNRSITWSVIDLATSSPVAGAISAAVSGTTGLVNVIGLTSDVGFRIVFGPDGFNGGINDITYTSAPISAVPLPAAGLLLIAGLGGLAAFRRRQNA